MNKKQLKKALKKALKENSAAQSYAGYGDNFANGASTGYGMGGEGAPQSPLQAGILPSLGLPAGFGSRTTEQFLLGALLGAAATYVLSDEELRGKIVKGAIKLYSGVAGGFEELKEQIADLKAEAEAGLSDDA